MSVFTKSELEELAGALSYQINCIPALRITMIPLFEKLEEMIESYCDHEYENTCCGCSLDKIYCHKCERYYTEESWE
jgi:hypothetical protein